MAGRTVSGGSLSTTNPDTCYEGSYQARDVDDAALAHDGEGGEAGLAVELALLGTSNVFEDVGWARDVLGEIDAVRGPAGGAEVAFAAVGEGEEDWVAGFGDGHCRADSFYIAGAWK